MGLVSKNNLSFTNGSGGQGIGMVNPNGRGNMVQNMSLLPAPPSVTIPMASQMAPNVGGQVVNSNVVPVSQQPMPNQIVRPRERWVDDQGYGLSVSNVLGKVKDMMKHYTDMISKQYQQIAVDVSFLKKQQNLIGSRRPKEGAPSRFSCKWCGSQHYPRNCPNVKCDICGKSGHLAATCWSKISSLQQGSRPR